MAGTSKAFARRIQVLNHLKNGNFLSIPRTLTFVETGLHDLSQGIKTIHAYEMSSPPVKKDAPGFTVEPAPSKENFVAFWDVWGALGVVGVNRGGSSVDSGNVLRLDFLADGIITFRQSFANFNKFKGYQVSVGLSGVQGDGCVKITMGVDTGTSTVEARPYFSKYFRSYYRMVQHLMIPLDISKFDFLVKIEGKNRDSVSISGACLAMGSYVADLPYSDNISDKVIPSGTMIMYAGENCPAGYRALDNDSYLLAVLGDPLAFRGDVRGEEMLSQYLGHNTHDHTSSRYSEAGAAAFEADPNSFVSPTINTTDTPVDPVLPVSKDTAGRKITILPLTMPTANPSFLDGHSHLMNMSQEAVEPPYVKVMVCEKI
jgi:hypothetical protein